MILWITIKNESSNIWYFQRGFHYLIKNRKYRTSKTNALFSQKNNFKGEDKLTLPS